MKLCSSQNIWSFRHTSFWFLENRSCHNAHFVLSTRRMSSENDRNSKLIHSISCRHHCNWTRCGNVLQLCCHHLSDPRTHCQLENSSWTSNATKTTRIICTKNVSVASQFSIKLSKTVLKHNKLIQIDFIQWQVCHKKVIIILWSFCVSSFSVLVFIRWV